MHVSKDSMWRRILKIFGFCSGNKQGLRVHRISQNKRETISLKIKDDEATIFSFIDFIFSLHGNKEPKTVGAVAKKKA